MVETKVFAADPGASNANVELARLTAADDETITILETSYFFTGAGRINAFMRNEELDDVDSRMAPDVDHPVVRNIVLKGGDFYSVVGTDTSAAANFMGMLLTYDRVTK